KAAAPPWKTRAGPLGSVLGSVGLAAEEGRNIELIVLAGIMHRRVAAMRVEAMRRGPARVFRDGLRRTPSGMLGAGTLRRTLIWRRGRRPRLPWHGRRRRSVDVSHARAAARAQATPHT